MEKTRQEITAKLRQSLELSVTRRNLLMYLSGAVLGLLMGWLSTSEYDRDAALPAFGIILGIFFAPFVIFYIRRIIGIFRKRSAYRFCRCKLGQPHQQPFLRGAMYFTVVIETPEGRRFAADTHAIFETHGLIGPLLEDYINRTVTVAYNEVTGMVVVIG